MTKRAGLSVVELMADLILVLQIPGPVGAASLVVNTVGDENAGICSAGDCSLREAPAGMPDAGLSRPLPGRAGSGRRGSGWDRR